jgi:hypothetical protein
MVFSRGDETQSADGSPQSVSPNALFKLAATAKPFIPPSIYRAIHSNVARRNANRYLKENGVFDLAIQVAERFDYRVQAGPFQGMIYTKEAVLSRHATPALLGQYERQLYTYIVEAAQNCDLVIDVGHAEGYYAVGLARLGKRVVAYDADPHERRICRGMARANGVRLEINSWCSPGSLYTVQQRALVICDIEGGEYELLSSEVASALAECWFVVELHSTKKEDNAAFLNRFSKSHDAILIDDDPGPRNLGPIGFLGKDAARMAAEYRPAEQQWLVAKPRGSRK